MKLFFAMCILALSGCATQGTQMSAEQLKAIAADKNFSAVCSNVVGPWGNAKFVYANVDRSVVVNGTIAIDANCLVTMSNEATVKAVIIPPLVK